MLISLSCVYATTSSLLDEEMETMSCHGSARKETMSCHESARMEG